MLLQRRPLGPLAQPGITDHQLGHVLGRHVGDFAAADPATAPQDAQRVGKGRHFAKLVGDHQSGDLLAPGHCLQPLENFVGLGRGENRRRLVENEKALIEIEQFQNLGLLLFAGDKLAHQLVERAAQGHALEKGDEPFALA